MFEETWTCNIGGIMYHPSIKGAEVGVETLNFLGVVLERSGEEFVIHQKPHILGKLKKRDLLTGEGSASLPALPSM